MKRPNILWIWTDQQRWDTLRATGNPLMHTPNLDRLAAAGTAFTHAYCNDPVCMPSRQSALSGQYPSTIGCTTNGIEMPLAALTLHRVLKPYGYHTANLGKLHFLNHSTRDHREAHPDYGFDTAIISDEPGCYEDPYIAWVRAQDPDAVEDCRCTSPPAVHRNRVEKHPRETETPYVFRGPEHLTHSRFVTDLTVDYLRAHRAEPFFCIAGFYAPHCPIDPPKRFVDLYDPADMPLPARAEGDDDRGLDDDAWRRVVAHYYALVSHVDDCVGRILDALDELGLRDDTLIIFTSDHGENLGDHGHVGKGPPGWDSAARVPLLIAGPGVRVGQVVDDPVELVDLAPTVCAAAAIQVPPTFQGQSLLPTLRDGAPGPRDTAFIEFRVPRGYSTRAIASRDWKYCRDCKGDEWLYDKQADPAEIRNLAADPAYADILASQRAALLARWFTVEAPNPVRTGEY